MENLNLHDYILFCECGAKESAITNLLLSEPSIEFIVSHGYVNSTCIFRFKADIASIVLLRSNILQAGLQDCFRLYSYLDLQW